MDTTRRGFDQYETPIPHIPVKCPGCKSPFFRLFVTWDSLIYQCAKCTRTLEIVFDKSQAELRVLPGKQPASEPEIAIMLRPVLPSRIRYTGAHRERGH